MDFPKNLKFYRNGNLTNFFTYARNTKDFRRVVNGWVCMYELNNQLRHMQLNMLMQNEKKPKNTGAFPKEEHKHDNPVTSL